MITEITLLATWPAQENADGYRVRLLDAEGTQLDLQDVAANSAIFGPLSELTAYQIELVAYNVLNESTPQLLTLTTPEGEAGASGLVVAWEGDAIGDAARLLDGTGTLIQDLGEVASPVTLNGLTTGTDYQFELTRADATLEVIDFTTPIPLPGSAGNLQYTSTSDALTVTWTAAEDAAEYEAVLSKDGVPQATQTVTDLTVSFTGLSEATTFTVDITASNQAGNGPAVQIGAETKYTAPAAPTGVHQPVQYLVSVQPHWTLPDAWKTREVQIQLQSGINLLEDRVLTGAVTQTALPVRVTETPYSFRVRAGNPGGWSEWSAWADFHTEPFPHPDSVIGLLAATHQEDKQYITSWSGSSYGDEGVKESIGVLFSASLYSFEDTLTSPLPRVIHYEDQHIPVSPALVEMAAAFSISTRSVKKFVSVESVLTGELAVDTTSGFAQESIDVKIDETSGSVSSLDISATFDIASFPLSSVHEATSTATADMQASVQITSGVI